MMYEEIVKDNEAFIFGFDNVLYPEKDYLLQVYYLFSEFIEYTEQITAKDILVFMQSEFTANGASKLFEKTAGQFRIDSKYKENFEKLHENARLPLKLLLYQQVLVLLKEIVVERKQLFILTEGNPPLQINKIKQMEWNGLEQYLKVYFVEEFKGKTIENAVAELLLQNNLDTTKTVLIGKELSANGKIEKLGLKCFPVTKIL